MLEASIYTEIYYANSYRPWVNSYIFSARFVPFPAYLEAEYLDPETDGKRKICSRQARSCF